MFSWNEHAIRVFLWRVKKQAITIFPLFSQALPTPKKNKNVPWSYHLWSLFVKWHCVDVV
jgi:hypothetical protein